MSPHTNGTADRVVHQDTAAPGGGSGGAVTQGTSPWTVDGNVGVLNFPSDYPDAAAEASLDTIEEKFIPSTGFAVTFNTSGLHEVHACPLGQRLKLLWIGLATNDMTNLVIVEVLIGAAVIYRWPVGAFAHGMVRLGDVDEDLSVNLSGNQTVYVNYDLREVA